MKFVLVLVAALAVVFAEDYYTNKYDSIDIDAILASRRLVQVFVKCLLDTGKCNEEGQVLRDIVPDALLNNCKRCSPTQKPSIEKVIRFLAKNYRSDWDALVTKYDPQGQYRNNYKKYYDELMTR